jgi:hypothetical protein
MRAGVLIAAAALAAGCGSPSGPAGVLTVARVSPLARSLTAPAESAIVVTFDRPVRRDSVTARSLRVFGRWSGPAEGAITFADDGRTVVFAPRRPFSPGESVSVTLSRSLAADDGSVLRPEGHAFSFWVRTRASNASFVEMARLSTRATAGVTARAYGGIASDLDGDGRLDLAIVNEDAADVTTFVNEGGFRFRPKGRAAVGRRASPSEPADFDGDGRVDMAVVNITDGTVSILRGQGDGTFAPAQTLAAGRTPRGVAVLDADVDGDTDVTVANYGSSDVTVFLNDGAGRFAPGRTLEAGLDGEWALAAADMDADGVTDLVVGGQDSRRIAVLRGRGDGTFVPAGSQDAGGLVWMIVTGDLDRDGHEDVAAVNGRANNAAILRGDGRGGLMAPRTYSIDPFGLASDLGDLDGDGDLDWVTSSYSGDWRLFENAGDGSFTVRALLPSPLAASCALPFDADGDGDLDLALIDEEADEILILRNGG